MRTWEAESIYAQNAEEVVYANLGSRKHHAQNAEEVVYANMVEEKVVVAKTAEEVVYANMEDKELNADYVNTASIKREQWTLLIVVVVYANMGSRKHHA